MRLTVFGATGATGAELVRQALASGHHVEAVARRPDAIAITHPHLTVSRADVLDPAWSVNQVKGADAVLSALGSRVMKQHTTVYSQGVAAIIAAMRHHGVRRFVGISAIPVGLEAHQSMLERRLMYPLLHRFFGGGYDDMRRMEQLLADSGLDWTLFRPPALTNGRRTERYRTAIDRRLPRAWSVSRSDLAHAMLAALDDTTVYRRAVAIAR